MKARIVMWIFRFLRWYFLGRKVTRMTMLDGRKLYRDSGKVLSGVIRRDESGFPVELELFVARPGYSMSDLMVVPVTGLRAEKELGWVFYD